MSKWCLRFGQVRRDVLHRSNISVISALHCCSECRAIRLHMVVDEMEVQEECEVSGLSAVRRGRTLSLERS